MIGQPIFNHTNRIKIIFINILKNLPLNIYEFSYYINCLFLNLVIYKIV